MEGLALLVAGLLGAPVVLAALLATELLGVLASVLCGLVEWLLRRRADRAAEPPLQPDPEPPREPVISRETLARRRELRRRWLRRIQIGLAATLITTLLAITVVNAFFLDEAAAWAARRVEARTGIVFTHGAMEGNLFTGVFRFADVRVRQDSGDSAQFDFRVHEIAADLAIWQMICGRRHLDSLTVTGVVGAFTRLRPAAPEADRRSPARFEIRRLTVTGGTVQIEDRSAANPVAYAVRIESVTAEPLRSRFLWFDLLYRSNLRLAIDGTKIIVENRTEGRMRHTLWSATDAPAPVLASLVGGPFTLFSGGRVDVVARDSWRIDQDPVITMEWLLRLREARAAVPANTHPLLRPPVEVFVAHMNGRTEPWELGFVLELRESQFAGAATLDARQIWAGALEAILRDSLKLTDSEGGALKGMAREGLRRFEELLKKRSQREEPPQPSPAP